MTINTFTQLQVLDPVDTSVHVNISEIVEEIMSGLGTFRVLPERGHPLCFSEVDTIFFG